MRPPPEQAAGGGALGRAGLPVVLLGAYLAVYVVWFLLTPPGPWRTAWSDFAFLPPSVVGLCAGVGLLRRRDLLPRLRAAWAWILAAVACRLFADVTWWWLEAVRGLDPFPSTADVGYCAFYPCLLAGLLLLARDSAATGKQRLIDALDTVAVGGCGFVVMWFFILGPVVEAGGRGLADALNVYYPVADVVVAAAAARIVMRGFKRSLALPLLLLSCTFFVVADSGFAFLSTFEGSSGGQWIDIPWIAACVLLAAAVDVQRRAPGEALPAVSMRASRLPLAAATVAGALLVHAVSDLSPYPVRAIATTVVVIMCVTAARQLVATQEYAHLARRYRLLATRDVLTGVASRGEGMAQGEALVRASAHRGSPCSVLMLDMDGFKEINDELGHPAGDAALVTVAQRITAAVRSQDLVCRYGGDEFLVVLPGADAATAAAVAERIETGVAAVPVLLAGREAELSVTACAATTSAGTLAELVDAADAALLARKAARRRVPRPRA